MKPGDLVDPVGFLELLDRERKRLERLPHDERWSAVTRGRISGLALAASFLDEARVK